jgi:Leucine-rich repeat (LRR) protein
MKLAQQLVDEKAEERKRSDAVVTVWFNAWQYEQESHPIIPLIGSIVRAVEDTSGVLTKARKSFLNALRAIAYGFSTKAEAKLPLLGKIEASFKGNDTIDRYEELAWSPIDSLLDQSLYFKAFEALEQTDPDLRIVVFIDDLDRCFPQRAVHLLEAIKLVLSQKGFVFVLGVAHQMLEQYVRKIYVEDYKIESYGTEGSSYLDKIVQLPLPLPSHEKHFERFLTTLLDRGDAPEKLREAVAAVAGDLGPACHNKPRSAVRLLNNLLVDLRLLELSHADDIPITMFLVSRVVQQAYPRLYEILVVERPWLGRTVLERLLLMEQQEERQRKGIVKRETPGDEIEESARRLDESLKDEAFRKLFADRHLRQFLLSEVGRKWLEDEKVRAQIHEFRSVETVPTGFEPSEGDDIARAIRIACERENTTAEKLSELTLGRIEEGDWSSLANLTGLTVLELDFSGITDTGMKHLKHLAKLQSLILELTSITDAALEHLQPLTQLQELQLRGTGITDAGLKRLKPLTQLQSLDIGATGITDAGLEHLKPMTQLQSLFLDNTGITDAGLEHLQLFTRLRRLVLTNTGISGARFEFLRPLTQLTDLGLAKTGITDAALGQLKTMTQLQWLDISGTRITDTGLENLKPLTQLRGFSIDHTSITDEGLEHLQSMTKLRNLTLIGTGITDVGLERLQPLGDLLWLEITDTRISVQAVERFQATHPETSIHR